MELLELLKWRANQRLELANPVLVYLLHDLAGILFAVEEADLVERLAARDH